MSESNSTDGSGPRSGLIRKLGIVGVVLLVLVGVLYFVVTSGAFFKSFILPRVGKAANAEITVADASISPFSQVVLDKVKVQTAGQEPLLTADQVRVRYNLMSILRGNYVVEELTVAAPVLQVIQEANGTSNLDPITKGESKTAGAKKTDEPLRLSIRNVSIKNGLVRLTEKLQDGTVQSTEVSPLNLALDRLENGGQGKVNLSSNVKTERRPPAGPGRTNDVMESKVNGEFTFQLDKNLVPQALTGNGSLGFGTVQGVYADFAGLAANLQADVTPTEVRMLAMKFQRNGQELGRVEASGPLDMAKAEGRLKLQVQSVDRQVLNLIGASHGWDFGNSTLNATNFVDISHQGDMVGAKGVIAGRQMSVRQGKNTTPPVDLDVDYEVTVNRKEQVAVIRRLSILGQQQGKDLLRASLDRPMNLTWAPTARGFAESTLQLAVNQLKLDDWRSVLGTNSPSGRLDLQMTLLAKEDGKKLEAKGTLGIQDLTTQVGTNRIEKAGLTVSIDGDVSDFRTLTLKNYTMEMQRDKVSMIKSSGSAHYDRAVEDLTLQASTEVVLAPLLKQFPQPDIQAANGTVRLNSALTQKKAKYSVTGNLTLLDFTGRYGKYAFQDYQTAMDYNLDYDPSQVQIHNASLAFRKGYSSGGTLALQGDYNMEKKSAHLSFRAVDLNENALGPILAPAGDAKQLISVSLNGNGTAAYDPSGDASVKADVSLTNWVVATAANRTSPKLGARVVMDGSMRQSVVDVRQFDLRLAPTARAINELQVKAHLDMGKTNPSPSQLTVQADSLDITPYYEIFAGSSAEKPTTSNKPSPAPQPAPPTGQTAGSTPAKLPVDPLTAEIKVGRLYFRDLAITNFQTSAQVSRGEVTVKPVAMSLNGAPFSASAVVNMNVPGYSYDIAFKGDRLPVGPLVSSFTTNAPGQYKGDLTTAADLKGVGFTGSSLQKSLSGNFSLNWTNLNYEIVGRKVKRLLDPIALVLRVPELTLTPLNAIDAKVGMGKGQVNVEQFIVQSQAFYADSRGSVPIAEILTNSPLNLPVNLALRRSLAEKANLLPANTPTNALYAQLPSFVTLAGTLGDPKTEINKLVIGGLLARSIGGIAPVGDKAGSLLQGVGGLLTGQTSAARTNAPTATNASPAANIVQDISSLLNQPKKGRTATNAPAASAPTSGGQPAKVNANDLLKVLPEKK